MKIKWGQTPFNLLRHPRTGWEAVAASRCSITALFAKFIFPGSLLSALAVTLGVALFNREWSADFGYDAPPGKAFTIGLATLLLSIFYTFVLAWVFARMGAMYRSCRDFGPALTLATFGSLPVWFAGVFMFFMPATLLGMLGFVYTCLLYSNGAATLLGVKENETPEFVAVSLLLATLIMTGAGMGIGALELL